MSILTNPLLRKCLQPDISHKNAIQPIYNDWPPCAQRFRSASHRRSSAPEATDLPPTAVYIIMWSAPHDDYYIPRMFCDLSSAQLFPSAKGQPLSFFCTGFHGSESLFPFPHLLCRRFTLDIFANLHKIAGLSFDFLNELPNYQIIELKHWQTIGRALW